MHNNSNNNNNNNNQQSIKKYSIKKNLQFSTKIYESGVRKNAGMLVLLLFSLISDLFAHGKNPIFFLLFHPEKCNKAYPM